jgi:hypothetical protein
VSVCFPCGSCTGLGSLSDLVAARITVHMAHIVIFQEIREVVGLRLHKSFVQRLFKQPTLLFELHGSFSLAVDLYHAAGHLTGAAALHRCFSAPANQNSQLGIAGVEGEPQGHEAPTTKLLTLAQCGCHQDILKELIDYLPIHGSGRVWVQKQIRIGFQKWQRVYDIAANHYMAAKTHQIGCEYPCRCTDFPLATHDATCHVNCPIQVLTHIDKRFHVLAGNYK